MGQATKRGPLPPEYAAINYATGLYRSLRCERGWRADVFALLRREYEAFNHAAAAGEFGVQSMWEYLHLIEATNEYLAYKGSRTFSAWFYRKAYVDLKNINVRMKEFPFNAHERESMGLAFDRMVPIIKRWRRTEEARE